MFRLSMWMLPAALMGFGAPPSVPAVTGPVPNTAKAPDPSHGYPFNPSAIELARKGYVEEEFLIEGVANQYDIKPETTATVIDGGHPYKTRIVVRRPASAKKFNGTAIVEWTNVTGGRDLEMDWFQSADHFVRSGYAWIGVSAQRVGVNALKAWSPERYASVDVTAGGKFSKDELSYDIFTEAGLLVKGKGKTDVMGGLKVERLIATGHSQSAGRLTIYVNSVHPLNPVYDAVMLHGGAGKIRGDIDTKVFKTFSETDVRPPSARQPDSDKLRTWEVGGTSHVDAQSIVHFSTLGTLNAGLPPGASSTGTCDRPPYSRVPFHYVFNAAFDHMVRWIKDGTPPPVAAPIEFSTATPPVILRDEAGNALGGIRLAAQAVPTAQNTGQNSGTAFCRLYGSHVDFTGTKLAALYPSHKAYVAAVKKVTEENLKAGYIVKADAEETISAAEASNVGGPR